jgi:hypothetical protein
MSLQKIDPSFSKMRVGAGFERQFPYRLVRDSLLAWSWWSTAFEQVAPVERPAGNQKAA